MNKRSQELARKANEERRRCRDWMLECPLGHDRRDGDGKGHVGGKRRKELRQRLYALRLAWSEPDPDCDGVPTRLASAIKTTTGAKVAPPRRATSATSAPERLPKTNSITCQSADRAK